MTLQNLTNYKRNYYFREHDKSCDFYQEAYYKRVLRCGDIGSAICYALGITNYEDVKEVLRFPEGDNHDTRLWIDLDTTLEEQFVRIRTKGKRKPSLVFSIGCGRGELETALHITGVNVIGSDPCPVMNEITQETVERWTDGNGPMFLNMYTGDATEYLIDRGLIPDTVIFCESIEHIHVQDFDKAWNYLKSCLKITNGLLVITNFITFHPINASSKWDHITRIDDAFMDNLASQAKSTIFRQGSHLVLQF